MPNTLGLHHGGRVALNRGSFVAALVATLLLAGCGGQTRAITAPASRTLDESSQTADTNVPVQVDTLVGSWRIPTEPVGSVAAHQSLEFDADGTGMSQGAVDDPGVPGLGPPYPFTWEVADNAVTLQFKDGLTHSFDIESLTKTRMVTVSETESARAPSGTWVRSGE